MRRRHLLCASLFAWAECVAAAPEEVVVIVNKDNPNSVDLAFVQRAYLGTVKSWPDGSPLLAFDQPEDSDAREQFSLLLLRKSISTVKAIWAQNIFTGKGYPPKVLATDAEMRRIVAANRHAIGYIRRSQLDDSVRSVAR